MRTFSKLLIFFWGNDNYSHARIIICIVFIVTGSLLVISLPWILKIIIDKFSNNTTSSIILILVSYGVLWGISQIIANVRELIAFRPIENSISRFGLQVFKSLTNRNFKYSNDNEIGRIMNAIERAQESIPDILASILFVFMPMIIEICFSVGIIFYFYGAYYSSTLFVLPIVYIAYSLLTSNMLIKYQLLANKSSANVSSFLADVLLNIQGIYYQSAHRLVNAACETKLKEREEIMTKQLERTSIVNIGQNIIASLGLIVITTIVGFGVINNELIISDFVLFNGYLLQFIIPLNMIGILYRQLLEGITKLRDAVEIIDTYEEEPVDRELEITKTNYSIRIKNVYFKYQEKNSFAVNGINLDIPMNQSIAFVGYNGSGKTTLTKLLLGLYDNFLGDIYIGDNNIKNISRLSLAKMINIAPQDVFILNTSVYENIIFGNTNIDQQRVKEIIGSLSIDNFINLLPEKINTIVGENGKKLSGGQRQLIGIARALLCKPKILILDEATSAIDKIKESKIYEYLSKLEITKIIITHDNRNLDKMDRIVHFEYGKITNDQQLKELHKF